jgi:hypothetical protein
LILSTGVGFTIFNLKPQSRRLEVFVSLKPSKKPQSRRLEVFEVFIFLKEKKIKREGRGDPVEI